MADEPSWEDLFNPQPRGDEAVAPPAPAQPAAPMQAAAAVPPPLVQPAQPQPAQYARQSAQPVQQPQPAQPVAAFDPNDPFAALYAGGSVTPTGSIAVQSGAPLSRRELRESEGRKRSSKPSKASSGRGGGDGGGYNAGGYGSAKPKKRRLLWLKITLPILLVLGAAGGAAAYAWFNYEEQVRELLGWQLPIDYAGSGNGVEAVVTIQSGDFGSDIATSLHDSGVTMTFDAFYDLLLSLPQDPGFQPGNYALQEEMSAQSALDALLDPANKITDRLLITEGTILPDALEIIAETTGIPLEELQTASLDLASFGLPAEAPSLEGYLFPATYQLDGGQTAQEVLQLLVDEMFERLDDAGVPVDQRHTVLTMAALIQREAGPNPDDFFKISRVFTNRLEQGMNLESDATVAYGAGTLDTVWTTDEDRADASNPYNTYANPGLPIGPIGLPGDLAIEAAMSPADGPWLFFVPINLATGETVFSETVDEHEAAVQVLRDWCDASEENASYCE